MWLYALLIVGGSLIATVHSVSAPLDAMALRDTIAGMAAASLLMCVIQLWIALRFRSFVPPLVLGILGTFVSVAAASAREGAYFPWLMPLHMLSTDLAKQAMAFRIGALGGCAALLVMLADLARREA